MYRLVVLSLLGACVLAMTPFKANGKVWPSICWSVNCRRSAIFNPFKSIGWGYNCWRDNWVAVKYFDFESVL